MEAAALERDRCEGHSGRTRPRIHTSSSKPTIQSACSDSRGERRLDQSSKITSYNFLATMDLKSRSNVRMIQTEHPGFCRGKNRYVDELHIPDPGHNLTSSELLSEQAIAEEGKPCHAEVEPNSTGATRAKLSRILSAPVCYTKETIPTSEKEWKIVPAYPSLKGRTLSAAISKLVIRLVRHYDEEERETDGAVHWDTINPKLLRAFGHQGARDFSEKDWLQHIY